MDTGDAAPPKRLKTIPAASPKRRLRQFEDEDLPSSPHPPQPAERLIHGDGIKDNEGHNATKKRKAEFPHAPPQCLMSPPTIISDGFSSKKIKNSATASARGLSPLEDLPDDLALNVLLRLSTGDAARVSSLSRRCRKVCSLLPVLIFHCNRRPPRVSSISAALAAHDRAADIRYLSITFAHVTDRISRLLQHGARLVIGEFCLRSLSLAHDYELDAMLDKAWRNDQTYIHMPCFDRASQISLRLGFLKLEMPRDSHFVRIKILHMSCFGCRGKLSLSRVMFPLLEELSPKRTFGFNILEIDSHSLNNIKLCKMIGLSCLIIKTPNLKILNVFKCLEHVSRPMAKIDAPLLEVFRWSTPCHPYLLREMKNLKLLNPPVITSFGPEEFTTNENGTAILRKFPAVEHLELDIEVVAYNFGTHRLMPNIDFPKSEILSLHVKTSGHSCGTSVLHVLQMCRSIKVLNLTMEDLSHVQNRCPPMCSCYNPEGWATQRSQMISLKEVTVLCLNGMNDEFRFLEVLLNLAPGLQRMKLIGGPHFQRVRQRKPINFQDASKNVHQDVQILASLVPANTLEVLEYAYDNKSGDSALVPVRFDNEEV